MDASDGGLCHAVAESGMSVVQTCAWLSTIGASVVVSCAMVGVSICSCHERVEPEFRETAAHLRKFVPAGNGAGIARRRPDLPWENLARARHRNGALGPGERSRE